MNVTEENFVCSSKIRFVAEALAWTLSYCIMSIGSLTNVDCAAITSREAVNIEWRLS